MLGLTLLGVLLVALALPVPEATRNQVIGLLGLLLSAAVAFSSTTFVTNFMAGIMLRVNKPFRTGDFVHVADHFGRVTERGLLDTEIQTETRELVALPNSFIVSHPVSVIRSSGAMVSLTLSLGYDVHHARVEELLVRAAKESGLEDPFLQVIELGDFSVCYRINGLLTEVKGLLSARSELSRCVLDALHEDGVEIVSPSFMNQRRLQPEGRIIASPMPGNPVTADRPPEEIVFDKAEKAAQFEREKSELQAEIKSVQASLGEARGKGKERLKAQLELLSERLKSMESENLGDDDAVSAESPPQPQD
jgi:small conductance mechanosensitive channel